MDFQIFKSPYYKRSIVQMRYYQGKKKEQKLVNKTSNISVELSVDYLVKPEVSFSYCFISKQTFSMIVSLLDYTVWNFKGIPNFCPISVSYHTKVSEICSKFQKFKKKVLLIYWHFVVLRILIVRILVAKFFSRYLKISKIKLSCTLYLIIAS